MARMPSRKSSHRAGLRATRIISAVRPTSFSPRMARCSSPTTGPARSTASATRSKDGAFERLRLLGNEWPQFCVFERRHSGSRAQRASPESITPIGSMDSGPAPSGASTMCTCTSGNDESHKNNIRENHMPTILGSDEHRYRVVENWAKLPDGWNLTDVASVAVDSKDRVYVFNRGTHPMVVLDRLGNFITSWGEGLFNRAHGLHIDADDNLYCTDDGDHTVRKCSTSGKVLLTIGIPNKPAPFMSGEPFHRCTHTALSPKGEIYVSDGYG